MLLIFEAFHQVQSVLQALLPDKLPSPAPYATLESLRMYAFRCFSRNSRTSGSLAVLKLPITCGIYPCTSRRSIKYFFCPQASDSSLISAQLLTSYHTSCRSMFGIKLSILSSFAPTV